jgi:acetyltransferase-like isoleucine patch superfamily enzyme
MSVRYYVASSPSGWARQARALHRAFRTLTLPVPHMLARALLAVYVTVRGGWHAARRICIAQPLFKAYCREHGKGLRTDIHVHWIQGRGDLIVGDDVMLGGKSVFNFASRFDARPRLTIGSRTHIEGGCTITVARRVSIGSNCLIATGTWIFDSSGHPTDPARRQAGEPPTPDAIKPVIVRDNVWIGGRAIVFPGVTIGEGSIVSPGSVVMTDVPPFTIVAGNPARVVQHLQRS